MTITIDSRPRKEHFAFLSADGDCLNVSLAVYDPANEGFTTNQTINMFDEFYSHICDLCFASYSTGSKKFQIIQAAGVSLHNDEFDQYATLKQRNKITVVFN